MRRGLWRAPAMGMVLWVTTAIAAGPPVVVSAEGTDPGVARRAREVVASRRAVREDLALPPAGAISSDRAAMAERAASIRLALDRARHAESEASWDACVREAAEALPAAIEVLGKVNDLALLRDLHVQIGACLTLAGGSGAASARTHFVSAALLDESEIKLGLHREEAERAQAEGRAEVLARARGKVTIETEPPGAEVWIDGRLVPGVTPLQVEVRLGDHYVTPRRFRFETSVERALLQPSGKVHLVLDPAGRATLREQLAAVQAGAAPPSPAELRLARAVWSRAEQVVAIANAPEGSRVEVIDAITGRTLKASAIPRGADDEALRKAVCDALGETCEVKAKGIPWYVWPIAGVAVAGGAISAGFIINNNRDYKFVHCTSCVTGAQPAAAPLQRAGGSRHR